MIPIKLTSPEDRVLRFVAAPPGGTCWQNSAWVHGWFFLSQQPAAPPPSPPTVSVTLTGDVRWIDGATPHVWRSKGGTAPLVFPLASAVPHIVFRRRMRDEMFADESRPAAGLRGVHQAVYSSGSRQRRQSWTRPEHGRARGKA
jgi:hypothetical protein